MVVCIPAALIVVYFLYGRLLLSIAFLTMVRRGVRCIVVTSDSPHWKDYIERNWLSRIGDRCQVLNWSKNRKWSQSLEAKLYYRFGVFDENYYPSVILFRGLRHPLVFRFYHAFRDLKHDNDLALRKLEDRLFTELESRDT